MLKRIIKQLPTRYMKQPFIIKCNRSKNVCVDYVIIVASVRPLRFGLAVDFYYKNSDKYGCLCWLFMFLTIFKLSILVCPNRTMTFHTHKT